MENVVAGQLLCRRRVHLFPADDADVVRVGQLLFGGVGIVGVHVVDGPPGEDDVVEGLLEGPGRQVHGTDGEKGEGVDADHDGDENQIEYHLKVANYTY